MRDADPAAVLARHAAGGMAGPLPAATAHAARRATLDWFATTLPGCVREPATLLAAALASEAAPGDAICYVTGARMAPRQAALLNATASHIVEFDDIFRDGGYHPGSPTVAAALALAQDRDLPLEQFQRALVEGYEVGARIALAVQPSHYAYWHTTATVGTMGAATACACLLGCDEDAIGHAIALASSFAAGHQQSLSGGMAKAIHAGHAAEAGMLAALAAAQGARGAAHALDGPKGFAAATSDGTGNWAAALDGLGAWTAIERMTTKAHGCCGHIFPALDGLAAMSAEHDLEPEDVVALHVDGYGATKSMCDRPEPTDAQDARFSLQYCLAAQMRLGAVRLRAFEAEALRDPGIRALARRITVSEAPDLAAEYPRKRMARLRLTHRDGRVLSHFQPVRRGDPEDPLDDAALAAKFDELASSVLDGPAREALKRCILSGEELPGGDVPAPHIAARA